MNLSFWSSWLDLLSTGIIGVCHEPGFTVVKPLSGVLLQQPQKPKYIWNRVTLPSHLWLLPMIRVEKRVGILAILKSCQLQVEVPSNPLASSFESAGLFCLFHLLSFPLIFPYLIIYSIFYFSWLKGTRRGVKEEDCVSFFLSFFLRTVFLTRSYRNILSPSYMWLPYLWIWSDTDRNYWKIITVLIIDRFFWIMSYTI